MASKILSAGIAITIIGVLIVVVPFSISLPEEVILFFENNPLQILYNYANFFFPIGFALKILIILWLSKYISLLWKILNWIYRKIWG